MTRRLAVFLALFLGTISVEGQVPVFEVTGDDFKVTHDVALRIDPDRVIADTNRNGVIHILADDVTVTFTSGSRLRGAAPGTSGDLLSGIGVRVDGHRGVVLQEFRVHGYRVGIYASDAPDLIIRGADVSDGFRQRLGSTAIAEDSAFRRRTRRPSWCRRIRRRRALTSDIGGHRRSGLIRSGTS